ncbi:MAG: hypothetical protein ACR2KG_00875 [Nocardioidaceae bacterium]
MFTDRIVQAIPVPTGDYDDYGAPITTTSTVTIGAEVRPLGSLETVNNTQDLVHTRYRLFLPRTAILDASASVSWAGATLQVEGDLERHTVRGRVHHLEAIVVKTSG